MNSPAIRFAGFAEDWEERKLGDLCCEFRSGEFIKASDITPSGNYPVYGGNGLRGHANIYNHDGDFALIGRQGALCGNMQFSCGKAYFTEHAIAVMANNNNETRFLYYLFGTMNLGQYSGQSAQPGLAVGNLNELKSLVPLKAEQKKVSGVFSCLDRLITLHQREHDKTVNIKKALLEKMFPKAGEDKPEIRFAGFSDDWERRKLGDLGSVVMNRRIFKEQTSESGDIPFYKIGTFGAEPDSFISRELFEEYKSKYPYPKVGDILISASGSIGRIVEYTGKDEYFQDSNIVWLQHDERLNNSFLKHFYSVVKWHGLEGSTIKRLYNKNILDTKINVPSLEEQQVVGTFFDLLSDLIALHQRELTKLQNIKKALLEKMFV